MGTCYSKKASGGNFSYTTAHMATTKLDEASRLARPTPYARNENNDSGMKRVSLQSGKQTSLTNIDPGNIRTNFQSNIPRFSSSLPVSTTLISEQKSVIICNDNETLHVVNNNAIMNSRSVGNVTNANKTLGRLEPQAKTKSGTSKSCPDKVSDSSEKPARSFLKGSGVSRTLFGKAATVNKAESPLTSKLQQGKETKSGNFRNSRLSSPASKSPSGKGSQSRESLSDFDSGLGNSLGDKSKPEDSDTIKDLEHLELTDELTPNIPTPNRSTGKQTVAESKLSVKAPTYRREPNGKWSFDEKHFGPETVRSNQPKVFSSPMGNNSPRDKHSFKMNAPTYASYKSLLSYQKKSYKSQENCRSTKGKSTPENNDSPSVPKVRKQLSRQSSTDSSRNSTFYVQNNGNESTLPEEDEPPGTQKGKQASTQTHQKKLFSPDSDVNTDSTGVLSPPSDRQFLIDDEIADQPGLTIGEPISEESDLQSLQMAMTELHALSSSMTKKRTDSVSSYNSRKGRSEQRDSLFLGSELGSSCSSIASDDLMLDYEKPFDGFPEGTVNEALASPMRKVSTSEVDTVAPLKSEKKFDFDEKTRKRLHRRSSGPLSAEKHMDWRQRTVSLPLRPPRQMTVSEADDGGLKLDSSSYRLLCQDMNGVKTLLLRLKTVIQEAETINPFDQAAPSNIFYHSLAQNDFPVNLSTAKAVDSTAPDFESIYQENSDLRREIVLLHQQLEEKDHTIHLLQQQMTKYLNVQGTCNHDSTNANAATQTERSPFVGGSLPSSISADGALETLVTINRAQKDFERSFRKNSKEHTAFTERLSKVLHLLDQSPSQSDC